MIRSFTCSGYRGLGQFCLEQPGRLNLLVGPNNSGKTSVLESLLIAAMTDFASSAGKIIAVRTGNDLPDTDYRKVYAESWERVQWLFSRNANQISVDLEDDHYVNDLNKDQPSNDWVKQSYSIEYTREGSLSPEYQIEQVLDRRYASLAFVKDPIQIKKNWKDFSWNVNPLYPVLYMHPASHHNYHPDQAYNRASKRGRKPFLIQKLALIDPKIEDMDIVYEDDDQRKPVLHMKHQDMISSALYNFGDGLCKSFEYASRMLEVENGLLLIDELESSLHPQALHSLAGWLLTLAEELNVQIFATTHSLECIDILMDVLKDDERVILYRLKKNEQQVTAVRYDANEIRYSRLEIGTDLRYSL